jgi:hypothetical protein
MADTTFTSDTYAAGFHDLATLPEWGRPIQVNMDTRFTYTFRNFFHPFVGELIQKINRESLPGVMNAKWQADLAHNFFKDLYDPSNANLSRVESFPKEIDVSSHGPYANYNWELFFHIPLTIAVHLSKTQRFAEAQRWFHYIFDPTSNDKTVDAPERFWKFLAFRNEKDPKQIDELLALLSKPVAELTTAEKTLKEEILEGYAAILNKPFQPHAVARTRHLAYRYGVVMKYLDNLIAWGDHLFRQDTIETINEATQIYVLAANLLGPRPQAVPPRGTVAPKTFAQLKALSNDPMGNALVELEGQFPFNLSPASGPGGDSTGPLFGIGRTLYFSIPRNEKMLGYWDTVADRLFKIRNSMNIEGIVRQLALFDPPIDPGMLVKAAAAGIDIGSIVSGLNQPVGPVRALTLIQKSLELCGEVRGLGTALLGAIEKGDAEHLSQMRQRQEVQLQRLTQEVRFLQWRSARETTKSLLTSRQAALERLHYYQRLLGLPADPNAPDAMALDRRELTEENFDEAYAALVAQYDRPVSRQRLAALRIAGASSASQQSGASGSGRLFLNTNEDAELNSHLPRARDSRLASSIAETIGSVLTFIPEFNINLHFWGMGGSSKVFGGSKLADAARIAGQIARTISSWEQDQASMAGRTAGHERRADEWMLQHNQAAHELMQLGRQILTSLIGEQIARREYLTIQQQVANAQEVDQFLHDKFTNEELYLWMQGETSRLYYEYYRFAFDTARKAERTMKHELMRTELDAQDFVKFNYWDGGRKGLLSGEALYLDVKRMELAMLENNKRELEMTRHVSLRQLDPLALLKLKATGSCQVTIPEWLYDRDCPGHYMRRIKSVALSIPSVTGPYTSVNCTLSLLRSSIRKSPIPKDGEYARQGTEDDRFIDYAGAVQSVVTSAGSNDSGMFETSLRDDRFLPFEGAGAVSTWKLDLPAEHRTFDYATISDVVLHVRYTARQGVDQTKVNASLDEIFAEATQSDLALLFSLRHDFPTEWSAFVNGTGNFAAKIRKDYFPYAAQQKTITITRLELYDATAQKHHDLLDPTLLPPAVTPAQVAARAIETRDNATDGLADAGEFVVTAAVDAAGPLQVMVRDSGAQVFLVVGYVLE